MKITKSDGTVEEFSKEKLEASLRRSGAASDAAVNIAEDVARGTREGATTHDVYRRAFALLREHRRTAAARYSLKRAVLEFGPSGFPFESYLAEIFRAEGFDASTDRHIRGRCVEHEVDVVLSGRGEEIYVEAKFHNTAGFKTDLQVAMYVQARVEDIAARLAGGEAGGVPLIRGMLVTNTKFTSLAIEYAECQKLEMLSWDYPAGRTLHDRIEAAKVYPITALSTLSRGEKASLMTDQVVLCRDLTRHEDALARAGVRGNRLSEVLVESGGLCDISGVSAPPALPE